MFFIFRTAFWLALVIALIPVRQSDLGDGQRAVSAVEVLGLAGSVASDVVSFCDRNGETCETSRMLFSQMGTKAREGARIAYSWLDDRFGPEQTLPNHSTVSGEEGLESEGVSTKIDRVETGAISKRQQ